MSLTPAISTEGESSSTSDELVNHEDEEDVLIQFNHTQEKADDDEPEEDEEVENEIEAEDNAEDEAEVVADPDD